jgi:uncharacterized protein (TIGR02588 family)
MKTGQAAPTPLLELVLAAISAVLIAALIAYLLVLAARSADPHPPDVAVRLGTPERIQHGWLVRFEAANTGDEPISQLRVEMLAGEERAETVIDFLAARSITAGGFFLTRDPATTELRARPMGYVEP